VPERPVGTAYIINRTSDGKCIWGCRRCDWTIITETDEPLEHQCGTAQVTRIGDRVESALTSLGITKERWEGVRATVGLPPGCSCNARKQWLNRLDQSLQLGEKLDRFSAALGWSK
jgi:hypothetical protein